MLDLQVGASFDISLPSQAAMMIHPLFDLDTQEWVVDVGDETFVAPTLRGLKKLLPHVRIKDYFPDGFTAERVGFLTPSTRSGWYPTHQVPTSNKALYVEQKLRLKQKREEEEFYARHKREFEEVQAAANRLAHGGKKKQIRINHELLLDMYALGLKVVEVARQLHCTTDSVQRHLLIARKVDDERVKRLRVIKRTPPPCPPKIWPEDDTQLRKLARDGLSSEQIGLIVGVTRNAVIGRCSRRGIKLHGDPMRNKRRIQHVEH